MNELKYLDILQQNKELGVSSKSSPYSVTVLSNIIVHQIKEILEFSLRGEGINANVEFGDYDNIIQDSEKYQDSDLIIIFWELCNIVDGLQFKVDILNESQFDEIFEKIKFEIDFVLKNTHKTSFVLINKFTSLTFFGFNAKKGRFDKLADRLNNYLEKKILTNTALVEINKVIASVGISNSLSLRQYYSSKSLYTIEFFKFYVEFIKPFIMAINGKSKKIIVFDCDNTLWKGVLGEDGFSKIEMSSREKNGSIFAEVQTMALALNKQGILIGLCSKNNLDDINEVIISHPDMQLKKDVITIKKINWKDKVSNLQEIANELNVGLDSLVFVDDSSFEVNLIREKLPEVTVLQVPKNIYEYPQMFRKNLNLFYNLSTTLEDNRRNKMYENQLKRESTKPSFVGIEDYLTSLELKMTISENDKSIIPRMSQLSQKTNQFNLTTKRYTENDIKNFIDCQGVYVYTFSVSDKFGDSGITGLGIISIFDDICTAKIDTFLMSCRIIGRNIEYAFMDYIVKEIKNKKIKNLSAKYIKTRKNKQVEGFYDVCSFDVTSEDELSISYVLKVNEYKSKKINYLEVISGK